MRVRVRAGSEFRSWWRFVIFERELVQPHAALEEFAGQQLTLQARQAGRVSDFIAATELRWSRDDEEAECRSIGTKRPRWLASG